MLPAMSSQMLGLRKALGQGENLGTRYFLLALECKDTISCRARSLTSTMWTGTGGVEWVFPPLGEQCANS
jgi:hypothetical protein